MEEKLNEKIFNEEIPNTKNFVLSVSPSIRIRKEREHYLIYDTRKRSCFLTNEIGYKIIAILKRYKNISFLDLIKILKLETGKEFDLNGILKFIASMINVDILDSNINLTDLFNTTHTPIHQSVDFLDLERPLSCAWLITYNCNLQCRHCYLNCPRNEKELGTREAYTVIKKIADSNIFVLDLSGGEPLFRKDFVDLVQFISDFDISLRIVTNGTLLNDNIINTISKNVEVVQISLDGASPESHEFLRGKNTFIKTIESIKKLVEINIPEVRINCIYYKKNLNEIDKIIDLALKLGVNSLRFVPLQPWGRGEKLKHLVPSFEDRVYVNKTVLKFGKELDNEIELLADFPTSSRGKPINYLIKSGCIATFKLTILPNGDVIPCDMFSGDVASDFILGNIIKSNFEDIWQSPKAVDLRKYFYIYNRKWCKKCEYLGLCGSYCAAELYWKKRKLEYTTLEDTTNCRKLIKQIYYE